MHQFRVTKTIFLPKEISSTPKLNTFELAPEAKMDSRTIQYFQYLKTLFISIFSGNYSNFSIMLGSCRLIF